MTLPPNNPPEDPNNDHDMPDLPDLPDLPPTSANQANQSPQQQPTFAAQPDPYQTQGTPPPGYGNSPYHTQNTQGQAPTYMPNVFDQDEHFEQHQIESGRKKLLVMGILMIIAGAINMMLHLLAAFNPNSNNNDPVQNILINVFVIALQTAILIGGIYTIKARRYGTCMAASIIAILPCACCFIFNMPIGIITLVFLCQPEVKACFKQNNPHKTY